MTHKPRSASVISGVLAALALGCAIAALAQIPAKEDASLRIVSNETARRVDVFIGKQLFTAYVYPDTVKKPVLFPIRTARGNLVTRGFPLEPMPGERVDHPHQVGLWFNYGDVNGLDFWNNSDAVKASERDKFGTIVHREVKETTSGKDLGVLKVAMDWLRPDGKALLREQTSFIFRAAGAMRSIDRITQLAATDEPVLFKDNKEGVIGMRVARQLEQPATKAEVFTDASGKATAVPVLNNEGVTGLYHSSEGKTGDDVWGTRGRWLALSGKIGAEDITLAILDHPSNPGYPTYWHARGYGLFAANPLGQKAMSNGKEELNLKLEPKQSVLFRYRLLVLSEKFSVESIEKHYQRFLSEVK
jgi:hypothetical protein